MPFPGLLAASLALPAAIGVGRAAVARFGGARVAGAGVATAGGLGLAGFGAQQALTIGGNGVPRRRRRRALTADDMRTALTIASAISKKAAENFILQRTRR